MSCRSLPSLKGADSILTNMFNSLYSVSFYSDRSQQFIYKKKLPSKIVVTLFWLRIKCVEKLYPCSDVTLFASESLFLTFLFTSLFLPIFPFLRFNFIFCFFLLNGPSHSIPYLTMSGNIKVVVRCRPLNQRGK